MRLQRSGRHCRCSGRRCCSWHRGRVTSWTSIMCLVWDGSNRRARSSSFVVRKTYGCRRYLGGGRVWKRGCCSTDPTSSPHGTSSSASGQHWCPSTAHHGQPSTTIAHHGTTSSQIPRLQCRPRLSLQDHHLPLSNFDRTGLDRIL